jgi:predicted Zn finger-like uncharacterized protein
MIIQCEQCRTKFKLDDEKVSDRGVKVRCAKCRHVFVVRKDVEQDALADVTMPDMATAPIFAASDDVVQSAALPIETRTDSFGSEPVVAFDFGAPPVADNSFDLGQTDAATGTGFDFGDVSFSAEASDSGQDVADFGEKTMVMPPKQASEPAAGLQLDFGVASSVQAVEDTPFDFGDQPSVAAAPAGEADLGGFDFGDAFTSGTSVSTQKVEFDFGDQQPVVTAPAGDIDLGGFDFGEASAPAADVSVGIDATDFSDFAVGTPSPKTGSSDLGFSFDDAAPQGGTSSTTGGFDFSGMDFGTAGVSAGPSAAKVDTFSMGDMDFSGDTAAVEVDNAATTATGTLFAPVEETVARQQVAATPDITFDTYGSSEEAPPLAITSRRRQSSMAAIVIGIVTVVVVGVLGYMGYTFISSGPKAVSVFGTGGAPVEEGKVTVQNVKASYISKSVAGELLVITGEALNGYKKPRAALQVKATIFGATNQILATKIAYAGNQLTNEQLATMPAEKIEAAMNNQFGDSLANLEVQPGKTIPFTIVIVNPPKEGKDFGVESVGSTVAASK